MLHEKKRNDESKQKNVSQKMFLIFIIMAGLLTMHEYEFVDY